MYQVNERTTLIVTVAFYDEDDVLVVPSAATYRIDDVASLTSIVPLTNFPSLASQVAITITSAQNAILDSDHEYEVRKLTIQFNYGSPKKHGTDEYLFRIRQLYGIADTWASASVSPLASVSP